MCCLRRPYGELLLADCGVAGRGGELKEYVIGVQVFGKEPSFDPRRQAFHDKIARTFVLYDA